MIMSKAGFAARHVDHSWVMSRDTFNIAKCVRNKPMNQNDAKQIAEGLSEAQRAEFLSRPTDGSAGAYLRDIGLVKHARKSRTKNPLRMQPTYSQWGLAVRKHLAGEET